ncbi:MAG: hypothetical protein FWD91_01440 [Treponema sp.]|nr:hypothetical protein [Treponema sp.]
MTIREAAAVLGAEIVQGDFEDANLAWAYTSDLLSDVMAHAGKAAKNAATDESAASNSCAGTMITIQAHKNTVAVASLLDISAIIICNARPILDDMLEAARDEGIAIILSKENQFTVSGKLYALLTA